MLLTAITINLQAADCKIQIEKSKTPSPTIEMEIEYALQEIIDLHQIDTPTARALKKKKIEDLQALIKLEKDKECINQNN